MFEWESQNWPRRNEKHRDKKENKKEKKVSKSSVVNTYGTMTPFLPPQIDFTVEPTDLKIISRWRGVIPNMYSLFSSWWIKFSCNVIIFLRKIWPILYRFRFTSNHTLAHSLFCQDSSGQNCMERWVGKRTY